MWIESIGIIKVFSIIKKAREFSSYKSIIYPYLYLCRSINVFFRNDIWNRLIWYYLYRVYAFLIWILGWCDRNCVSWHCLTFCHIFHICELFRTRLSWTNLFHFIYFWFWFFFWFIFDLMEFFWVCKAFYFDVDNYYK